MAGSPVGVVVSTSSGRLLSFLVNSLALSFSRNGRTNESVFPVPVPIIRLKKKVLQDSIYN